MVQHAAGWGGPDAEKRGPAKRAAKPRPAGGPAALLYSASRGAMEYGTQRKKESKNGSRLQKAYANFSDAMI
jgi:hypothetical protein